MTLRDLRVALVNKAMNIVYSEQSSVGELGGVAITNEQAKLIAQQFGWIRISQSGFQIIEKTAKFTRGFKNSLKREDIWNNTVVTFENHRIAGEMKYYDRIKLIYPSRFDLTLTYNMPGTGGAYALFDKSKDIARPIFTARSIKQLCEYLDNNY